LPLQPYTRVKNKQNNTNAKKASKQQQKNILYKLDVMGGSDKSGWELSTSPVGSF
jgi:hypothetical protein